MYNSVDRAGSILQVFVEGISVVITYFKTSSKKACVLYLYMVYSNSGQENTRNTVRQANKISFERNLKKELAKLVRM